MGLKRRIKKIVASNYDLACAHYALRSYTKPLDSSNPIIVYQMGKVGSSSFEKTLFQLNLSRPLMKAHVLYREHMDFLRAELNISARQYHARHQIEPRSRYLLREIKKARSNGKGDWRFITMVRNPAAQNISSFFQLLDIIVPDLHVRLRAGTLDLEELRTQFILRYPADCFYNQWFDLELKASVGIDVLNSPFDPSKGYATYEQGCFNVLLLRLESLSDCANEAVRDYLGIQNFQLTKTNRGEDKEYADLYRLFREEVVLPEEYLDSIYNGRLAKKFYSPEEIESFRSAFRVD